VTENWNGAAGFNEVCPVSYIKVSVSKCLGADSRPQTRLRTPNKEIFYFVKNN
jgi:hypothetical protein